MSREPTQTAWGVVVALLVGAGGLGAQDLPAPASVLGFEPGTDSMLADWGQINDYLSALAAASDLVVLDTIGQSTLGRPLLMLTITSASNQGRIEQIKAVQYDLAHPDRIDSTTIAAFASQPAVVLINNNIHSTEIASSLFGVELAYRLAARASYRKLLDSLVVLMIPSTNPDGLDTVVSWYRRYAGTPFEAGPLPWLYHTYAGHDNNRDWFMITQAETRAISRVLYRQWFPEVVWDVHQMGTDGARLFLPPFADPVNPNLDPVLVSATNLVGTTMAAAVQDSGLTGVTNRERFDLWWHGGFRTVPARHNMIGILSEAASARLASPINIEAGNSSASSNQPAPWPGGEWRIGDIVQYELIAADGLVKLVSGSRASFLGRFVNLGMRAIKAGTEQSPHTYLISPDQRDREASRVLQQLLLDGGVDLEKASESFDADGRSYAAGTVVIRLAQPFRAHVKDLFEVQEYPASQVSGRPYDTAGWTLPLQMGVSVEAVDDQVSAATVALEEPYAESGGIVGEGPVVVISNRSVSESRAIAAVLTSGGEASITSTELITPSRTFPAGSVVLSGGNTDSLLTLFSTRYSFDGARTNRRVPTSRTISSLPVIGLFRSWTANMDEGWTRWVFDQHGIPYQRVEPAQIQQGGLGGYLDVLVLPSATAESLENGPGDERVPREYAGGIGEEGVRHLREFVETGGTLVALGAATKYAISALRLPVVDLTEPADTTESSRFLASGSIFGVNKEGFSVITAGMPASFSVYFRDGAAFRVSGDAEIVASYAADPLQSGYLSDPDLIGGAGALVDVPVGEGRVILFGFRPQHRGQTFGTFKALFNAVLLAGRR